MYEKEKNNNKILSIADRLNDVKNTLEAESGILVPVPDINSGDEDENTALVLKSRLGGKSNKLIKKVGAGSKRKVDGQIVEEESNIVPKSLRVKQAKREKNKDLTENLLANDKNQGKVEAPKSAVPAKRAKVERPVYQPKRALLGLEGFYVIWLRLR